MFTITLSDLNDVEHVINDAAAGQSLMEVAKAHGVDGILADCGGVCSCATCHVFIDPDWWDKVGEPDEIEFAMLDMVADVARPTSRLACQVKLDASLDGLRARVAPGGGY